MEAQHLYANVLGEAPGPLGGGKGGNLVLSRAVTAGAEPSGSLLAEGVKNAESTELWSGSDMLLPPRVAETD